MYKIINKKIPVISSITMLSLMISGCSLETNSNITKYETIYEEAYEVTDNDESTTVVSLDDLADIDVYFTWKQEADNVYYGVEFLKDIDVDGSTIRIDALSGYQYSSENIYYLETLEEEILTGNLSDSIQSGVDLENNTITMQSLRLLFASYFPYNINDIKPLEEQVADNTITKKLK